MFRLSQVPSQVFPYYKFVIESRKTYKKARKPSHNLLLFQILSIKEYIFTTGIIIYLVYHTLSSHASVSCKEPALPLVIYIY